MLDVVRSIISKRDPQGYYVIPLKNIPHLTNIISKMNDIIIEEYGDTIIVKTKSRNTVKRIVKLALKYKALHEV